MTRGGPFRLLGRDLATRLRWLAPRSLLAVVGLAPAQWVSLNFLIVTQAVEIQTDPPFD